MRLAKFLLNTLLFCITFVIILGLICGVTAIFTCQAGESADAVYPWPTDDENVSYIDGVTFWWNDMAIGFKTEDTYWARQWNWNWWQSYPGLWIDNFLNGCRVVFRSTFMPVSNMRLMTEVRIAGWDATWGEPENWYKVVDTPEFRQYFSENTKLEIGSERFNTEIEYVKARLYDLGLGKLTLEEYLEKDNSAISYKFIRLASHYNHPDVERYNSKFIDSTNRVKFSAITIYIHFLGAILLSIWFVKNNSFTVKRDEDEKTNVVEGGYNLPGFSRLRKKKENKKKRRKSRENR